MKLQALGYSLLGNGVLAIVAIVCAWQWVESGAECKADQAEAVVDANVKVRKAEVKRDKNLDQVTAETKADTRKAVNENQEDTRERKQAIERAVVRGDCVRPDGLPSLDAAVDQARASAGF